MSTYTYFVVFVLETVNNPIPETHNDECSLEAPLGSLESIRELEYSLREKLSRQASDGLVIRRLTVIHFQKFDKS